MLNDCRNYKEIYNYIFYKETIDYILDSRKTSINERTCCIWFQCYKSKNFQIEDINKKSVLD